MAKGLGQINRIDDKPTEFSGEPPTRTETQELPFMNLLWQDFEKLCYHLISKDKEVEEVKYNKIQGVTQDGIDIIAWMKDKKKVVYQCKRHKKYTPSQLVKAIKQFQAGKWYEKGTTFKFCISIPLNNLVDTIDEWKQTLREENDVNFQVWDSNDLSRKLKEHPDIVLSFFNEAWFNVFYQNDKAILSKKAEYKAENENDHPLMVYRDALCFAIEKELKNTNFKLIEERTCSLYYMNPDTNKYEKDTEKEPYNIHKLLSSNPNFMERKKIVAIMGGMGVGKSTFFRQLVKSCLQENKTPIYLEFRYWNQIKKSKCDICNFANLSYTTIKNQIKILVKRGETEPEIYEKFSTQKEKIKNALTYRLQNTQSLLLFDALDEFPEDFLPIREYI